MRGSKCAYWISFFQNASLRVFNLTGLSSSTYSSRIRTLMHFFIRSNTATACFCMSLNALNDEIMPQRIPREFLKKIVYTYIRNVCTPTPFTTCSQQVKLRSLKFLLLLLCLKMQCWNFAQSRSRHHFDSLIWSQFVLWYSCALSGLMFP